VAAGGSFPFSRRRLGWGQAMFDFKQQFVKEAKIKKPAVLWQAFE
jgi:hypothetical protein